MVEWHEWPRLSCSWSGGGDRKVPGHPCDGEVQFFSLGSRDVLPPWGLLDRHRKSPYTQPVHDTPSWPNSHKCYTVCSYQTTDRNIVIVISLSYITSFTQHKNRSLAMITIFLNVNVQYIYCIFKEIYIFIFSIYAVVVVTISLKTKWKMNPKGTDEWQRVYVRHRPAGGAVWPRMRIQTGTDFFVHAN